MDGDGGAGGDLQHCGEPQECKRTIFNTDKNFDGVVKPCLNQFHRSQDHTPLQKIYHRKPIVSAGPFTRTIREGPR